MPVSQQFINFLNLPLPQLHAIADELDISLPAGSRKWDIVDRLAKVPARELPLRAAQWFHAGRTSVTYVKLGSEPLQAEAVTEALTAMCDGVNPLEAAIRPTELTRQPTLIAAGKSDDEDRFFLSFGVKKAVARVLTNFEIEEVEGDDFFVAVLRLDPPLMEIRTNHERAERFTTNWIAEFNEHLFGDETEEEAEGK